MSHQRPDPHLTGEVVEDTVEFTLIELASACRTSREQLLGLVAEGVIEPVVSAPDDWRFAGASLRRARLALRLARDLELNLPGVALVLDMLDEIDRLRARLAAQEKP